ncbi:MAG: alpha-amylase family protein [Phycisphaerae bacterium]
MIDFGFVIAARPKGHAATAARLAALSSFLAAICCLAPTVGASTWQTLDFELTKNDREAYTTDLPADSFTPNGLKVHVKRGVQYSLTGTRMFTGDFSFDLQIEVADRKGAGSIQVEMVLVNDDARRKVVGNYANLSPRPNTESLHVQYFKDGKAMGTQFEGRWCDSSTGGSHGGVIEWLRIHKLDKRVWFCHKLKGDEYRWGGPLNYPETSYFREDCDSFKVGFIIHCDGDATGTVLIKAMRISGASVKPRDPADRTFLFDFGPISQELEDDFTPVSEHTMYSREKGFGWVIPEPEKIWYLDQGIPQLTDAQIAAEGYPPIPDDCEAWYKGFLRQCYWLQKNDKKLFFSTSHPGDWVEFFKQHLDLKTPLERDLVGLCRPYQFSLNDLYKRDVEERRGSIYMDDDLTGEFLVDMPNGNYNVIIGVGYSTSLFSGGKFNIEIQGRVRNKDLGPNWRRPDQFPVRNIVVDNGQMKFRFYADLRQCMGPHWNFNLAAGWQINYIVILPADRKELMDQWEWRIIRRRGEIIRRVTFVKGEPPVTRNTAAQAGQKAGFFTINGKPLYYHKVQNNYIPGDTEHVGYYCLANAMSTYHNVNQSRHFFKPDWEKLSYSDDYPWDSVDRMNAGYSWGLMTSLHHEGILSFVPHSVQGEGTPTVDSRGRQNRWNIQPPLNSALGKEIQKEAYTMAANQLGLHPGYELAYIYEELWHPDEQGYDDQSLIQYWEWLKRKYGTIEALNAEWGRQYKAFDEIVPPVPGKLEVTFSPEWANFRKFRGWAQRQTVQGAVDLIHKLEPNHATWGAKGDFGTQSWYTGDIVDGFGWYGGYTAASVSRHFGRTPLTFGYFLNCEHAYTDGRKQFDHTPGPRDYKGRKETQSVYNHLLSEVFKGTKGFWSEWYSDGLCHPFHRTTLIKTDGPKYRIKEWTNQIAFFEPEAYEGPPVKMERSALYAQRANQLLYRAGHLWLPAQPLEPKVLFPCMEESFWLDFFGPRPYGDFESVCMRFMRSCGLSADFMEMTDVPDLSKYQLIVLSETCQAITRRDAQRIRDWVNAGGKLIILGAGGFSDDARPRRYSRKPGEVYPLEEFAALGGYRIVASDEWHIEQKGVTFTFAKNDIDPRIADGAPAGTWDTQLWYEPAADSQVFLRGHLPKANKDVAMGLLNARRNVMVVNFPPAITWLPDGMRDGLSHPLAKLFRKLIVDQWKIDQRVVLGGVEDNWDWYAGAMVGDGYWLAVVCNQNAKEARKAALRLNFLPAGEYTIEDITGEPPDVLNKADGGLTLKPNPAARQVKIDYQMTAQQIAQRGIDCDLPPGQARMLLIRPAATKTWVSIWPPALAALASHSVTVAYGTAAEDKAGAEAVAAALVKVGVRATLAPAADVKRKKMVHEVRIKPEGTTIKPGENRKQWYLVDTFDNEVVDSDDSLIIVGSTQTNSLLAGLCKEGAFAYDKVLEKPTAEFPGLGRGVIGWIDAVNSPVYDLRTPARDAVFVGGSDAAGKNAAVNELVALIARNCTPAARAELVFTPPPGPASTMPTTRPASANAK